MTTAKKNETPTACPVDGTLLEDMGIPGSPGCFLPCKRCGAEWYLMNGYLIGDVDILPQIPRPKSH